MAWDAVTNATSYNISITSPTDPNFYSSEKVTGTSFDLTKSSNPSASEVGKVTELPSPIGVTITGNTISWNSVPNAGEYVITLTGLNFDRCSLSTITGDKSTCKTMGQFSKHQERSTRGGYRLCILLECRVKHVRTYCGYIWNIRK